MDEDGDFAIIVDLKMWRFSEKIWESTGEPGDEPIGSEPAHSA